MVAQRPAKGAFSGISSTQDEEISRVLRNFGVTREWMTEDFSRIWRKKEPEKLERKFVYRSIHVELSRESTPSVSLPSVSFLTTQKSTPPSTSTKFSSPFSRKDIPCVFGKDAYFAVLYHDSARTHTAAATVQWLENFGNNFILHEIGPLTLPICRPWIIRWMEFSSVDFGSGRHAAWSDWNGPCARSGQKCLLISVGKRFLSGNPVWNFWFRVVAFRLNTWSNFFIIFSGEKAN